VSNYQTPASHKQTQQVQSPRYIKQAAQEAKCRNSNWRWKKETWYRTIKLQRNAMKTLRNLHTHVGLIFEILQVATHGVNFPQVTRTVMQRATFHFKLHYLITRCDVSSQMEVPRLPCLFL
jgi:hypothetical protein